MQKGLEGQQLKLGGMRLLLLGASSCLRSPWNLNTLRGRQVLATPKLSPMQGCEGRILSNQLIHLESHLLLLFQGLVELKLKS